MARKSIQSQVQQTKFQRAPEYVNSDGFTITKGDLLKVKGEYGVRFQFDSLTTNTETGATWVDCFEMFRGKASQYRSFSLDRVKRIPKKRVKNVSRSTAN